MFYYPNIRRKSSIDLELKVEREEKLKFVNLIFSMSYDIEKTKVSSKRKPWLFRNSKLIFKKRTAVNGFIELFLKVFMRNSTYIWTYFQICSVTSAALIIVPPLWIKIIIFGGFLMMMWIWLDGTWSRIVLSQPFTKKYQEHMAFYSAQRWVTTFLFVISILIVMLIAGTGLAMLNLFS